MARLGNTSVVLAVILRTRNNHSIDLYESKYSERPRRRHAQFYIARDQCYAVRLPSMGAAAAAGQHGHGQQFETRVFSAGAAQVCSEGTLWPTTIMPVGFGNSCGGGNARESGNANHFFLKKKMRTKTRARPRLGAKNVRWERSEVGGCGN